MTSAVDLPAPNVMNHPTAGWLEFGVWSMGFEAIATFIGKEGSVI
jgi:hypothetical protein